MVAAPVEAAVRCEAVDKFYGTGDARTQALRGCMLEALPGEILMLVGPSGCGKTTLLSVIVGILDIDAGNVHVFGTDIAALSGNAKAQFRKKYVGFAFQQFNLIPALTALENAAIPLLLNGEPRAAAHRRAEELLVGMGMGDRLHHYPSQLSGGQQQRVAFSRALVHNPKLVVCDEPTSALDGKTGDRVLTLLRETALKADRAVIVVTHDSRIFHHADRIAEMEDGAVIKVSRRGEALRGAYH
jgi:putative ABC transport system ATP-binding protein